jgi:cytoskeletal protein RodZ
LPQYVVNNNREAHLGRSNNDAMIFLPLVIITVFCFGFVMMQPHKTAHAPTTASKQSTPSATHAQAELQPLSFASAAHLPLAADPSTSSTSTNSGVTQSTQMPQSSSSSTGNLQAANSTSNSSSLVIKLPAVATTVKPTTSATLTASSTDKTTTKK